MRGGAAYCPQLQGDGGSSRPGRIDRWQAAGMEGSSGSCITLLHIAAPAAAAPHLDCLSCLLLLVLLLVPKPVVKRQLVLLLRFCLLGPLPLLFLQCMSSCQVGTKKFLASPLIGWQQSRTCLQARFQDGTASWAVLPSLQVLGALPATTSSPHHKQQVQPPLSATLGIP